MLAFSNRLRSEGIDAVLDQYEEAPSEGWPRWTEKSINNANYVIVIASKGYYDKIYEKVDQGKGRGVKWEGNLIYQKLYMSDSVNEKFIPVVFDENDLEYIPTPLQGSTYYNVSDNAKFDKLYWRLRGVTAKEKPPLGKLRPLPEKERKTLFVTSMIDLDSWDNAVWRGAGFVLGYHYRPCYCYSSMKSMQLRFLKIGLLLSEKMIRTRIYGLHWLKVRCQENPLDTMW